MLSRLIAFTSLTLCFLNLKADWVPKFSNKGLNPMVVHSVFYLNNSEAFASGGNGYIYHTMNNWKDFETFSAKLPAKEQIEYIEMSSRSIGMLVTRQVYAHGADSSFIYQTKNGGYKWEKVFSLPVPLPSIAWGVYAEKMFFQRKGDNLYILFGDVICHGNINEKQWSTARYPFQRDIYNTAFVVLTDNIWSLECGANKRYTNNKGKNWLNYLNEPQMYEFNSSLGNSLQRITGFNGDNSDIEEYSFEDKTWKWLNSKFAMEVKKVLQLSNNYLLIEYWNWPSARTRHSVYDRKNDTWHDLISQSEFFDMKDWLVKGDQFVSISSDGRLLETNDFGQSWQAIMSEEPNKAVNPYFLTFNKNMGVAVSSYSDFSFSTDSGETWRYIAPERFSKMLNMILPAGPALTYDNDAELYLMGDKLWKIMPVKDSFDLIETNFKYNNKVVSCINISDKGADGIFVLGILEDSFCLFKSIGNGELMRLHTRKNPDLNEGWGGLIIQNKNYVVFSENKSVFCFYKQNGKVALLTDSLFNRASSLHFAKEDLLLTGIYNHTFIYDFKASKPRHIFQDDKEIEKYGFMFSTTSDGKGGVLFCNRGLLFKTDIDNLKGIVMDSTYKGNPTNIVRFWNGHYWAGSFWEIYKNEDKPKQENSCLKIQSIWPNPFQRSVTVQLKVEEKGAVKMQLYNSIGQFVEETEEYFDQGVYDRSLTPAGLSHGIYYLKVTGACGSNVFKLIHN